MIDINNDDYYKVLVSKIDNKKLLKKHIENYN